LAVLAVVQLVYCTNDYTNRGTDWTGT